VADCYRVGELILENLDWTDTRGRQEWSLRRLQAEVLRAASVSTLSRCVRVYRIAKDLFLTLAPPASDPPIVSRPPDRSATRRAISSPRPVDPAPLAPRRRGSTSGEKPAPASETVIRYPIGAGSTSIEKPTALFV
jgi:hypothetical protein